LSADSDLRATLEKKEGETLRKTLDSTDTSQYSPAVMHDRALNALNDNSSDALFDLDPAQIPYISYLRAINEKIPIPATMTLINAQMSLSRSKDRKGRQEFGSALNNNRPIIYPGQLPQLLPQGQPEQKDGLLSRLTKKKNRGGNNE